MRKKILNKKNKAKPLAINIATAFTIPSEISFEVILLIFKSVIDNISTHF